MIVVDTNIIAYLYLNGEHSEQVEQVLKRDADWAAPVLWRSELRNVLVHYLRKGLLSLVDASRIMDQAMNLMRGCEYEVSSLQVLELASRSACSAYDCEFVALAEDLNVPLVTEDRQILLHFPGSAVSLEVFSSQVP